MIWKLLATLVLGLVMFSPVWLPRSLDFSTNPVVGGILFSIIACAWLCGSVILSAIWED
jgi:hypothetical protein